MAGKRMLSASSPSRHKNCCSSSNKLDFYFADLAEFACPIPLHIKTPDLSLDLSFCGMEDEHLGQSRPAPDANTWVLQRTPGSPCVPEHSG